MTSNRLPSDWTFPRGFVLAHSRSSDEVSPHPVSGIPSEWPSNKCGRWRVWRDAGSSFSQHQLAAERFLLLFGHCLDPWAGRDQSAVLLSIAQRIEADPTVGDPGHRLWSEINSLTGRFRLIVVDGDRLVAVTDAMGLATLYFSGTGRHAILASHAPLVAEAVEAGRDRQIDELVSSRSYRIGRRHLPGSRTPFPEVRMLGANHFLTTATGDTHRFFPQCPLGDEPNWERVVSETAEVMDSTARMLMHRFDVAISLSTGTDSRTTLAAFASTKSRLRSYSYQSNSAEAKDAEGAAALCELLQIPHQIFDALNEPLDTDLLSSVEGAVEWNAGDVRRLTENEIRKIALLTLEYPEGLMEVKSPVSEVGRATYSKRYGIRHFPEPLSTRDMSNLYKRIVWPRSLLRFVDRCFSEFRTESGLATSLYDYSSIDMFFWEHRHAYCESLGLMDHDIYHDTTVVFNNRRLINNFLKPSFDDRLHDRLHFALIERLWPELLQVPLSARKSARARLRIAAEWLFFRLNRVVP